MTPLSWIYFLLGLSSLYWPFVTLFFKRRVLGAQWLLMSALMSMSLAVIIYSTFFNSFLKGEYLLVIIFMILSMFTPPLIQAAVSNLTDNGEKRPLLTRLNVLAIPAVVVVILMFVSTVIGGADMYRLWIQRGSEGIAHHFFAGSWRYNLIVAVHFYLYWFLIVAETTFVGAYSIIRINRFNHMLDEYYTVNRVHRADLQSTYLFVALNSFFVVFSYIMYPFNAPRPVLGTAIGAAMQAVVMFFIGYFAFRTPAGVENLNKSMQRRPPLGRNNIATIVNDISNYVEKQHHFRNPDLSVFILAEKLHVSEDEIVDAIHQLHGGSFSDYIDSVRIEFATNELLANDIFSTDNPEHIDRMAHHCGFLTADAFTRAFHRVTHSDIQSWCKKMG